MSKSFNIFRKASHELNQVLTEYKKNKNPKLLEQADKIIVEVQEKTKRMKFKTNLFGDKPYTIESYVEDLKFLKNYLLENSPA